jgi:hypothetical protein
MEKEEVKQTEKGGTIKMRQKKSRKGKHKKYVHCTRYCRYRTLYKK